jgi:hypothetical protein
VYKENQHGHKDRIMKMSAISSYSFFDLLPEKVILPPRVAPN